jgi:hypothetical protein
MIPHARRPRAEALHHLLVPGPTRLNAPLLRRFSNRHPEAPLRDAHSPFDLICNAQRRGVGPAIYAPSSPAHKMLRSLTPPMPQPSPRSPTVPEPGSQALRAERGKPSKLRTTGPTTHRGPPAPPSHPPSPSLAGPSPKTPETSLSSLKIATKENPPRPLLVDIKRPKQQLGGPTARKVGSRESLCHCVRSPMLGAG